MQAAGKAPQTGVHSEPGLRAVGGRAIYSSLLFAVIFSILVSGIAGLIVSMQPETLEPRCRWQQPLVFTLTLDSRNWTLTSVCSNSDVDLNMTWMTIRDENGWISGSMNTVPLSSLNQNNWATYRVLYLRVGAEEYVREGARIVVDAGRHPAGCRYELFEQTSILAAGVLR